MQYHLSPSMLTRFKKHLILAERSRATVEKYGRDAQAFAAFAGGQPVTKETVIAYKTKLQADGYPPPIGHSDGRGLFILRSIEPKHRFSSPATALPGPFRRAHCGI